MSTQTDHVAEKSETPKINYVPVQSQKLNGATQTSTEAMTGNISQNVDNSIGMRVPPLTNGDQRVKVQQEINNVFSIDKDVIKFFPDSGIDFRSWLEYFNQLGVKHNLSEEFKFQNFSKFITGSALQTYVNFCLACKNLDDIIEIFNEKFYKPSTSFNAFNNVKFSGSSDKLFQYFQTKVEMGRSLGLNTDLIVDGLTGGLPTNIKTLVMVKGPKTPTEWLSIVSQLVEEIPMQNSKSNNFREENDRPKFQNPQSTAYQGMPRIQAWQNTNFQSRPAGHNQQWRSPRQGTSTPNWVNNRPNVPQKVYSPKNDQNRENGRRVTGPRAHFGEGLPPSPCRYCDAIGITNAYHWGYHCINKNQNNSNLPVMHTVEEDTGSNRG